jgi:nicotinamide-nucleotide amidase
VHQPEQCNSAEKQDLRASARGFLSLLDNAEMTVATAESCTGGFLASLLTDIEGLSHCFDRGYVTYSKEAKQQMLGIDATVIEQHGAVSERVARAMAENSRELAGSDLALAITGLAGSSDPDESEGAGVIYVAAAIPEQSWVYRVDYGERGRTEVRNLATLAALAIGSRTVSLRNKS